MEVDLLHLEGGVPVLLVVGLLVVGSVVKGEGKVSLVLRHTHFCRVGDGQADVAFLLGVVVHHHPVHHSGLVVILVHAENISLDTIIEGTCRDLDLVLGLSDVVPEGIYLIICDREEVVGHEEGTDADDQADHRKRQEHSLKGYAGSLDGQELVVFTERTECHHRCQQGGQREGERQHCGRSPAEEFQYDLETQALADKFVDIEPEELHHENEHDHQQDRNERSHK